MSISVKFYDALFCEEISSFENLVSRRKEYSNEMFKDIFKKKYPCKAKKARLLFKNYKPTTEQIKFMIDNDYAFFFGMLAENQKLTLEEEAYLCNHGSERIKASFSLKAIWRGYEEKFIKTSCHKVVKEYYKAHGNLLSQRVKNLCFNKVGQI